MEMSLDRASDVIDDGAVLLAAGFNDSEHCFDEPASLFALCSETQFSPDDRMTQAAFRRVIRWLNGRITVPPTLWADVSAVA